MLKLLKRSIFVMLGKLSSFNANDSFLKRTATRGCREWEFGGQTYEELPQVLSLLQKTIGRHVRPTSQVRELHTAHP